jgi:hypothetical protein
MFSVALVGYAALSLSLALSLFSEVVDKRQGKFFITVETDPSVLLFHLPPEMPHGNI